MNEIMEKLRGEKHKKTTYFGIWRNFNRFVVRLDEIPKSIEMRVLYYITYLVDKGTQSSTIRSYVSAIKSVLADDDYELQVSKLILSALTRACKRHNDSLRTRLPIQRGLFELLLFEIERKYLCLTNNQPYLCALYQCIFVLAYFGLMRVSKLVGCHAVKAKDVHAARNKEKILIILYESKTHGKGDLPQEIKLAADETITKRTRKTFCPFEITNNFADLRGRQYEHDGEHFFVFADGSNVTPYDVNKLLKKLLKELELDCSYYGSHSFRIGRATDLMKFGARVEQIKLMVRWKSNTVFRYIRYLK